MLHRIQYISQGQTVDEQKRNILDALEGGCKMIQVRFKNGSKEEILEVAKQARNWCTQAEALLIINDSVDLALKVEADGVHLGLDDMSVKEARDWMGYDKIIGGTANTFEDVLQRIKEKCDYVGLGPLRFTSTKEKLSPLLGFEGFQRVGKELEYQHLTIPIYAIGGVVGNDVELLKKTGVYGIAVSSLITNASNKASLIRQMEEKFN